MSGRPRTRQPTAFLWLYALAWAGGAVAYVPFLTILLPARVEEMAGGDHVRWLALMTFCGAIAASAGGVLFGWLSDRTRTRRPWVTAGLAGTTVLLLMVPLAHGPAELLLLIVAWQLTLNMMLAPLAAWAADHVPPSQLGFLGGLLAFSPALGAAAGALVTLPGLAAPNARLALVAALVVACVLPALAAGRPRPEQRGRGDQGEPEQGPGPLAAIARAMWIARFLVQLSEAALFAYLYYYFRSIEPSYDAGTIARLSGMVVGISVPLALIVGRWSDRNARPVLPLVIAAALSAAALSVMALASSPAQAIGGYVVFGLSTTTFLSLHSAQTFRVLRHSGRRGRDLGLFNLTNTTPSLIMPWLTVSMVPVFGYSGLFLLLAVLAAVAALILLAIARRFRRA